MRPLVQSTIPLIRNKGVTGPLTLVENPGIYHWITDGVFGGTTVSLDYLSFDGVTWTSVRTCTSALTIPVFIEAGCSVRASLSGGSGPNLFSRLELLA